MRTRFDSSSIRLELERIGQQLVEPLTVFLIGGSAMAFRGLKDTTKDIDFIVPSGDGLSQLQAVLLEMRCSIVQEPVAASNASTHAPPCSSLVASREYPK